MEALLDYDVLFLAADGSLHTGTPIKAFVRGWAEINTDGVVRWESPVDAVGVFVLARNSDGHDGIAQIDAIIAVPEPAAGMLLIVGLMAMYAPRRVKRKNTRARPWVAFFSITVVIIVMLGENAEAGTFYRFKNSMERAITLSDLIVYGAGGEKKSFLEPGLDNSVDDIFIPGGGNFQSDDA